MDVKWVEGVCMMCHDITEIRHVNLYPSGSEGLFCCKKCENKLLEFILEKRREFVVKKKREIRERRYTL
jgi:hypothetical protein